MFALHNGWQRRNIYLQQIHHCQKRDYVPRGGPNDFLRRDTPTFCGVSKIIELAGSFNTVWPWSLSYLMALFERLGAFKTWAKETGTSRAVLARDKRLDEPLSLGITTDHLVLKNVSLPDARAVQSTPHHIARATANSRLSIYMVGCNLWYSRSSNYSCL
jgi:hypothetical protein